MTAPHFGRMMQRVGLPGSVVSLLYWLRHRCYVSPRAEVDWNDLVRIGPRTRVSAFTQIKASQGRLTIGRDCAISSGCVLAGGAGGLVIGDDVMIGPRTIFSAGSYGYSRLDVPTRLQDVTSKGIVIGDNVWIGGGCIVHDGVEIKAGTIVAAGSIVTKSLPGNVVAEGAPAKVVFTRR